MSADDTNPSRIRVRGIPPELRATAVKLRHRLTPAEQLLWQALQGRQLAGLRFRCQHPVGDFVLDFYCPQLKLAVEVDGLIHKRETVHDAARTQKLAEYGYTVIRFANDMVLNELPTVLAKIIETATALQAKHLPLPRDCQGRRHES